MGEVRRIRAVVLAITIFPTSIALADVQITNMHDLAFGSWSGNGNMQAQDDVCVYNSAGSGYLITVTASAGSYVMQSGANNLAFSVEFRGSSGGFTALSSGVAQAFTAADQSSSTCSGSTNGTIRLTVDSGDLLSAKKGSYSGTLNIQVDPN